ncbi:hypothetical protein ATK78_4380 [Pedobacter metabolipauper]|uniref:Uncharacterized protein n=1 Tax=Pedobacter metabolipauper TaxID=425513 RepID=A0A4V3D0K6_9SPHI|nr:hypothetical protein ATK78_4380 [Pedobacter metabolipauper]
MFKLVFLKRIYSRKVRLNRHYDTIMLKRGLVINQTPPLNVGYLNAL